MKNKFTLIELLVVIAIISIIMAIMLPTLGGIKDRAYTISCKSNLKNIGTQTYSFFLDNNNKMLPSVHVTNDGATEYSWVVKLNNSHMKRKDIFLCPALSVDEAFTPHGASHFDDSVKKASYVMNTIHKWADATISTPKGKSFGFGKNAENSCSYQRIKNPAEKIYITDSYKNISSADAKGIIAFRETDHGELPIETGEDRRDVGNHHQSGGFNALMGDMHVETIKESKHDQWVAIVDKE